MRKIYFIFSFFLLAAFLHAQQVGMYNHYFFKPMIYNPAFTGNGEEMQASIISRAQWSGFQNAPQLNIFALDAPLKEKKIGLGLMLISDRKGINQRTGGNILYSYRIDFSEDARLLLGLSAGVVNQTVDFSKAIAENSNDPTLFYGAQQKTTFDGNGGLAFIWKGLEIGASAMQILGNKINYPDNAGTRAWYQQVRHYTVSVKYKYYLSEEKGLSVAPQILMRIVPGTPLQYDGNINLDWRDKFWVGATYKSNYALAVNAGVCIHKKLSIGYSYEIITSSIGKYSGISHEIIANFKFGGRKKDPEAEKEEIAKEEKSIKKDSILEQRTDSLKEALAESQNKINQLNKKLEEQSRAQQQTNEQIKALEKNINEINNRPVNNQNSVAIEQLDSKVMEEGVWIATYPNVDYKDFDNLNPKPGYYVVVGTFFYRDLAIAETKRFRDRGYKGSNWLYSETKRFNYIFTFMTSTKKDALMKTKQIHQSGIKDAWVLELK
ncbi:MAG: PorP/SprF family type IX secretion system membrane protein [Bacteroidia bacterium]